MEKSGAWFSYDSQRLGQGRENAKAFLKANPDMTAKIEAAIRQNSGLIADQILAGYAGARCRRRGAGGRLIHPGASRVIVERVVHVPEAAS